MSEYDTIKITGTIVLYVFGFLLVGAYFKEPPWDPVDDPTVLYYWSAGDGVIVDRLTAKP